MQSGAIRPNQRGLVFLTPDRLSPAETFTHIFAGNPAYLERGAFALELRLRPHVGLNPGTQVNEMIHNGTLRIGRDFEVIFAGANPF
jgi:hypothetical protein